MNLNPEAISFRLDNLLENISLYKNYQKDLFSIIKVLEELNKEIKKNKKMFPSFDDRLDIEKSILQIKQKISLSPDSKFREAFRKNGFSWKMSAKEKGLLFTLKVILEMEMKNLGFNRGIDFNESEVKNFKIQNGTIYFPFTAITGVGEVVAEKIVKYRNEKGRIGD
jgi:hypothetical protein